MTEPISISRALARGFWTVNFPVLLIIFGLMGAMIGAMKIIDHFRSLLPSYVIDALYPGLFLFFFSSPFAGWIYWSFAVPKWKLWAYSRVDDVQALKSAAVGHQLIWPDGHIFEKTELCSKAERQQILRLEGRL